MFKVGVPAKSGVSGLILLVVPKVCGIAIFSPPLDKLGNSVRGIATAERIIKEFGFHNITFKSELDQASKSCFIQAATAITNNDVWQLNELVNKKKPIFDFD